MSDPIIFAVTCVRCTVDGRSFIMIWLACRSATETDGGPRCFHLSLSLVIFVRPRCPNAADGLGVLFM